MTDLHYACRLHQTTGPDRRRYRSPVSEKLFSDVLLPDVARPKRLIAAMLYSALAGQRLRPFSVVGELSRVRVAREDRPFGRVGTRK